MAIIWSDVTGAWAEIAAFTTSGQILVGAQNLILSVVNGAGLNVDIFGGEDADMTRDMRILLAAHMATMATRFGVGGMITSQSEGGASQGYANPWLSPRSLQTTSYGQMFWTFTSGTAARAGLVVG